MRRRDRHSRASWGSALVISALTAGVLDILYAFVFAYFRNGTAPSRILQAVASGAFGREAYAGGTATAAIGLGFHFLIAFIITAVFFAAASRMPALTRRPVITGALYGIGVYLVMNFVVIPLSRIGPRPLPATIALVTGVLVHMFLVGVPIASGARRAFRTGYLR
jgi:uncharacterized membrane protein YagU involved in acid resistance